MSVLKKTFGSQYMFVADRETGFIKGYRTVPDQGVGSEAKYGITTFVIN